MQYQTAESSSWGAYRRSLGGAAAALGTIEQLAAENAVVIFSKSGCCMCHAIKRLFCGMGVNPTVYELDQNDGSDLEKALMLLLAAPNPVPVVFIGGKLVETMDKVMASHINGSLVRLLKQAGALWL